MPKRTCWGLLMRTKVSTVKAWQRWSRPLLRKMRLSSELSPLPKNFIHLYTSLLSCEWMKEVFRFWWNDIWYICRSLSDIRHKEESDQIRLMRESMEDAREESRYEKYGMVLDLSEILNQFLSISTE